MAETSLAPPPTRPPTERGRTAALRLRRAHPAAQRGGGGISALVLPARRLRHDRALPRGQAGPRGLLRPGQPRHLREAVRALPEEPAGRDRDAGRGAATTAKQLEAVGGCALPHAGERAHSHHRAGRLFHREGARAPPAARTDQGHHRRRRAVLQLPGRPRGVHRPGRAGHLPRHPGSHLRRRQAHEGAHARGDDRHQQDDDEEGRADGRGLGLQGPRRAHLRLPEAGDDRAGGASLGGQDLARAQHRRGRRPAQEGRARAHAGLFARNELRAARPAHALRPRPGEHEAAARRPAAQARAGTAASWWRSRTSSPSRRSSSTIPAT